MVMRKHMKREWICILVPWSLGPNDWAQMKMEGGWIFAQHYCTNAPIIHTVLYKLCEAWDCKLFHLAGNSPSLVGRRRPQRSGRLVGRCSDGQRSCLWWAAIHDTKWHHCYSDERVGSLDLCTMHVVGNAIDSIIRSVDTFQRVPTFMRWSMGRTACGANAQLVGWIIKSTCMIHPVSRPLWLYKSMVRRQNSTTAEELARFQRLFPIPSWLMSGRTSGHQNLVSIFPEIDNCLEAKH